MGVSKEQYEKYVMVIKSYLTNLYSTNLINNKKEVLSIFPERKDIENLLKIILEIYYQYLEKLMNKKYAANPNWHVKINSYIEKIKQA